MNMRGYATSMAVILVCCASAFSKSGEQRETDRLPSAFLAGEKATLDDMVSILEKNRTRYVPDVHLSSLDLYTDALGRINAVRPVVEKKPGAPSAVAAMHACSLMTEAAVLQMR
ncbi:MAG: hypothetical protein JXA71_02385, partial [Chitinispirillaceae bacterium]|nr:hypothetical protein [Chitinispirillaceae bacterium]